jgi:hypothetical protein
LIPFELRSAGSLQKVRATITPPNYSVVLQMIAYRPQRHLQSAKPNRQLVTPWLFFGLYANFLSFSQTFNPNDPTRLFFFLNWVHSSMVRTVRRKRASS